jgi:Domain of unknown function (DUF1995)
MMMRRLRILLYLFTVRALCFEWTSSVFSFVVRSSNCKIAIGRRPFSSEVVLTSTNDDDNDERAAADDDEDSPLNAMRSILEASWNAESMGRIPSDPIAAANEAYSAIMKALDDHRRDGDGSGGGVFFVDLLLPAYDLRQGENLYDEVLAVEYCTSLAKCLKGKTEILVRDEKTRSTVQRVLDARERSAVDQESDDEFELDDDEDDDEDDDDDDDVLFEESSNDVDEDDDEDDADDAVIGSIITTTSDVDSFRKSLMSQWDNESTTNTISSSADTPPPEKPRPIRNEPSSQSKSRRPNPSKTFRLASMLGGTEIINDGPDMPRLVIDAVRRNAMAQDDEENIIILSPTDQQEMVGVRGLVTKYAKSKKIVLVNCRVDPMPLELSSGELAYSVLPLIGREIRQEQDSTRRTSSNKDNDGDDGGRDPPRVVILRRYPSDWEVHVDIGNGFELAGSSPVTESNKRGLTMEWVGQCVQSYLDSVSRSSR